MEFSSIKRNDIVYVNNPIQVADGSHIMRGNHYAVVVQNDKGNEHSGSVIVCYLTSKVKRLDIKTNVALQFYDGLYGTPAMVLCSQIMTVDKNDISKVVDHLRPEDEIRVNAAIKASLALEE